MNHLFGEFLNFEDKKVCVRKQFRSRFQECTHYKIQKSIFRNLVIDY